MGPGVRDAARPRGARDHRAARRALLRVPRGRRLVCVGPFGGLSRSLRARRARDAPRRGQPRRPRAGESGALPLSPQHGALRPEARWPATVADALGRDRRKLPFGTTRRLDTWKCGCRSTAVAGLSRWPPRASAPIARAGVALARNTVLFARKHGGPLQWLTLSG